MPRGESTCSGLFDLSSCAERSAGPLSLGTVIFMVGTRASHQQEGCQVSRRPVSMSWLTNWPTGRNLRGNKNGGRIQKCDAPAGIVTYLMIRTLSVPTTLICSNVFPFSTPFSSPTWNPVSLELK